MNEENAGLMAPEQMPEDSAGPPLLREAREIEKQMFGVMTTQVKLAVMQVVLAFVSILAALVIAALR